MKKYYLQLVFLCIILNWALSPTFGQQEERFTQFMYNKLQFNPAFAGVPGRNCLTLSGYGQWIGLDGAPNSQLARFNMPLLNNRIGLGFGLIRDAIGPQESYAADIAYAYHLPAGDGFLSIGIKGNINFLRVDFDQTNATQATAIDGAIPAGRQSRYVPNFGLGLYYYTQNWYLGFSIPKLLESDITFLDTDQTQAREIRHYHLMGGARFILSEGFTLEPQVLLSYADGTPFIADVNLNATILKRLLVGTTLRIGGGERRKIAESTSFLLGAHISRDLFFTLSYGISFSDLKSSHAGSLEGIFRWCFGPKTNADSYVNPRFY